MRAARLYLRLMVGLGTPFGVLVGLYTWNAAAGLIMGLSFGALMAATVGTLTLRGHRGLGGALSPRVCEVLQVPAESVVIRRRALDALRALQAEIVAVDVSDSVDVPDSVVGRTRVSWRSWGERITVELRPVESITRVTIRSRPRVRTTLVDYGRGRRNVEYLVRTLQHDTGDESGAVAVH
ncbi:hypothetical protein UG55_103918 [Frankia sp. EI5c]|uniref:hypothetical protein n=1 Tax=Frankia sp. EI5c TaxID=683316 RepID=UPI0007C3F947|nr:hypothetical protein [Frankia sp. EI5c]OAA23230.1 hypothetical protein UG55_103918 [Frankia sp. EI5c]